MAVYAKSAQTESRTSSPSLKMLSMCLINFSTNQSHSCRNEPLQDLQQLPNFSIKALTAGS